MSIRRWKLLLSDRYPFLTDYFTKILTSETHQHLQSILFYGNDFEAQYTLAKEIARILNCTGDKSDDCDCLNCRWIRENTHPAVMTISKADNKPEDDKTKTVISVKQSTMIKERLMNDSEYHRVFILCDRDDDGKICGLNRQNFQEESANSMLKIIEEPQSGITFIFLTRYIDDVLSTIVSRSQCFFVPSKNETEYDYSIISGLFENYWEFKREDVFDISKKLQDKAGEAGLTEVLTGIQNYMLSILKSNPEKSEFFSHIKLLEEGKKQAKLGIKPANIFDDLCLKIIA